MTVPQSSLYCFGLGYSALEAARLALSSGWRVAGTVRSAEKAAALKRLGIDARLFPAHAFEIPGAASHLLVSIPPDDRGCPAFRAVEGAGYRFASVTYLSTTGVYGDLGGGWVFEWSPLQPGSARAGNRVLAEQQWAGLAERYSIVRLPGIYGPGRSPLDRVRAGDAQRVVKPGQVFSRVHVDDIASGLAAILAMPEASGVFHLCDDEPAPPQDVTAHAARLLGLPVPPDVAFDAAELSPMARSFYAECKRVSNARAKSALRWRPQYPTYREGLSAILAAKG